MNSCTDSERKNGDEKCGFERNLEILREIELFSAVPFNSLKAMALLCRVVRYDPQECVFRQGEFDHKAYYLIEGSCELLRKDDGAEHSIGILEAGQVLGAMALLSDVQRLFSLRVVEPLFCLEIDRNKVFNVLLETNGGSAGFLKVLVKRIVHWEDVLLSAQTCESCTLQNVGVSLV